MRLGRVPWSRSLSALVLVLVLASGVARADDAARLYAAFAHIDESAVVSARGFGVPRGGPWNRVVVGRHRQGEHVVARLVLVRCDRVCRGQSLWLGEAEVIEVLGVMDLDGPAVGVPDHAAHQRPGAWYPMLAILGGARRARFPVLVVRTRHEEVGTGATRWGRDVTGTAIEERLRLISLRAAEQGRVVFDEATIDRSVIGAGTSRTLRFERVARRGRLRIAATEAWHDDSLSACLPPPPVAYAYEWRDRGYQRVDAAPMRAGCH